MKYYPLSQIETGFTSKGGEFKLLSPNNPPIKIDKQIIGGYYVGKYFKTSDGKFFTGKTTTDPGGVVELQPMIEGLDVPNVSIIEKSNKRKSNQEIIDDIIDNKVGGSFYTHEFNFRKLTKKEFLSEAPSPPKFKKFIPVEKDFKAGIVDRYFAKHIINENIIEISKETYDMIKGKNNTIQHELYKIMNIKWLLVDYNQSSDEFNKKQIIIASNLGFRGLKEYIQI